MKKLLIIALLALGCTSCATIFTGTHRKVQFDSDYSDYATLSVDGRRYKNVTFPCKVNISRGYDQSVVTISAEGYKTETIVVDKDFNTISLLNLTNLFGWIIDVATGAVTTPERDYYWVELTPRNYDEEPVVVKPIYAEPDAEDRAIDEILKP